MRYLLFFMSAAVALLAACKFEAEDLPVERPFVRDFYVEGEWRDTGQATPFVPFDYTVGRIAQQPFSNIFTSRITTALQDGYKQIQGHIWGASSSEPVFFVRFFSDSPAAPNSDAAWSAEELEALFPEGRVFLITGATREVEIGLGILHDSIRDFQIFSESKLAPEPEGWVRVLGVEDYVWNATAFGGAVITRRGKKVRLAFEAKLGRRAFFSSTWPEVGEAEVRQGEASLYFEHL